MTVTRGLTMLGRLRTVLEMIKFSHTVFALPFALAGAWLAARGMPPIGDLGLILLCAVTARCAAMGFNRLADRELDARNPRTETRALPARQLTPGFVRGFVLGNVACFLLGAYLLNALCFYLSPVVLAVLLGYSYLKRVTVAVHLVLGLALGLAPMGAWLAVRGAFDADLVVPLLLGGLVLTWVSAFDIVYACQDVTVDRREGLHSVPARYGIARALWIARGLHVLTALFCVAFGWVAGLSWCYVVGAAIMLSLLVYQHLIVRADDLSRVNVAFFSVNGWVGILFFLATACDLGVAST